MLEFFGRIMSMTATLVAAAIFLLSVALLARFGLLDEAGRGLIALLTLPVKLVDLLINLGQAATDSFGGPTPTTLTGR